jgi:hypothetical protein
MDEYTNTTDKYTDTDGDTDTADEYTDTTDKYTEANGDTDSAD